MKCYVVHANDGQITEMICTTDEAVPADAVVVDPDVSLQTHYISNGKAVKYPMEVVARRLLRPEGGYWKWSMQSMDWADPRPQDVRLTEQWKVVREQRNDRLRACDWTVLPDSPVTGPVRAQWITYRQALRDITQQADPFNIQWPAPPA